jgi:hypothetical protein
MPQRKLTELDAEFTAIDDSYGVLFDCPACERSHSIYVPWTGRSPFPSGAIWKKSSGEDLEALTLSPSIDLSRPWVDSEGKTQPSTCQFHGFVENGIVRW